MKKYEEYTKSPYRIMGIVERSFMTKEDETLTVDPETGDYYTMKKVSKSKNILHDELPYTKLFQDNLSKLMELSNPALRVMMYAMTNVRPIQQTVTLNVPDVAFACNLASSTVYNAMYELLDKKLISKKLGSYIDYWFDPNVFFNGNRLRLK
jgi:hypothetical protein